MADITISYTAADGSTLDSDLLSRAIYERKHEEDSLAAVNGRIELENLSGATPSVTAEVVRRGAYTEPRSASASLNADYFSDPMFLDIDLGTVADYAGRMVHVSGAGTAFRTKRTATALVVLWHISVIVSSDYETDATNTYTTGSAASQEVGCRVALYLNGRRVAESDMRLKKGSTTVVDAGDPDDLYGLFNPTIPDARYYSGLLVVDGTFISDMEGTAPDGWTNPLLAGFHNASLAIATDQDVARVRCRRMAVIPIY